MENIEFELILLKNLTHNSEYFSKVIPILKPKHLQELGSKELLKLIKDYYSKYSKIPSLEELVSMVRNVPNSSTREQIVNILKEVSKRELIDNIDFLCDETVKYIKDSLYLEALMVGSEGLQEKNDTKKLKAQEILEERSKINIDSDLGLDFDDLDKMIEYYQERHIGVKTQHKELNKRIGAGFVPKTLSLFLAASGIGKSLMMTDLISGMIKMNKNVLLVSMEMQDREIMKRVHANALDLPINSLIDLSKTQGELAKLNREIVTKEMIISAYNRVKTEGKTGKLFIKEYPAGTFTPLMLDQLIHQYKIEKGIEFDIVFLDYIGIMASDRVSPSVGLYSYIKSIAEETRAIAQKHNLPIVSASQLNRGVLSGDVKEADNSNVSDSMGTVMTADFMLFLLQDEEMKARGEIVLKCTKNRFTGKTDTWVMNIDYEKMRFSDMLTPEVANETTENIVNSIDEDFGIITADKLEHAEKYANDAVKEEFRNSAEQMKNTEVKSTSIDDELANIYKELNIL